jgi:DNA-binding IclR family transcriptional regulator
VTLPASDRYFDVLAVINGGPREGLLTREVAAALDLDAPTTRYYLYALRDRRLISCEMRRHRSRWLRKERGLAAKLNVGGDRQLNALDHRALARALCMSAAPPLPRDAVLIHGKAQ